MNSWRSMIVSQGEPTGELSLLMVLEVKSFCVFRYMPLMHMFFWKEEVNICLREEKAPDTSDSDS